MAVELFGLPGSGKSTVAASLRDAGVSTLTPFDLVVRHRLEVGDVEPADPGSSLSGYRDAQSLVDPGSPVVVEEGITFHVWRELFLDPSREPEPWQALLCSPLTLVALDAPAAVLHGRIAAKVARGPVNRRLLRGDPDGGTWARATGLYDTVLAEAARSRRVERIDTTAADVDDVVAAVRAYL